MKNERPASNPDDAPIAGRVRERTQDLSLVNPSSGAGAAEPSLKKGRHYCSLIVPVYRNEATIEQVCERIDGLYDALEQSLEAVFVVDGSPDRSYEKLVEILGKARYPAQLLALSRNFGSFAAVRMGLQVARGDYFAVMAADLQEPAELFVKFFETLKSGSVDVVVGTRRTRADPFLSGLASALFWRGYRAFVQPEIPMGGVDVFACTRTPRDALLMMEESNSTLIGLLFWIGYRRKEIAYDRAQRQVGQSGWSWRRKLKYLMDSCFAFSDLPIRTLLMLGAVGVAGSIGIGLVVLLAHLAGEVEVAGYVPIMLAIGFSLALNLLSLGIVGSYTWRAFENTKRRPQHLAMSHKVFDEDDVQRKAAGQDSGEGRDR